MINSTMHKKENVEIIHKPRDVEKDCREILKELGLKKPKDEPLTQEEWRQAFVYMQEELFVGS